MTARCWFEMRSSRFLGARIRAANRSEFRGVRESEGVTASQVALSSALSHSRGSGSILRANAGEGVLAINRFASLDNSPLLSRNANTVTT